MKFITATKRNLISLLLVLLLLSAVTILTSCFEDDPIVFKIEVNNNYFYLDSAENDITFGTTADTYLGKTEYTTNDQGEKLEIAKDVEYIIVKDDGAEGSINGDRFSAGNYGVVTVQGKCGDLLSENTVEITVCYSASHISANLQEILFNNAEGVILGKTYETGITKDIVEDIKIIDADGLLRINDNGQLEVIGIGYGQIKILNTETNEVLYNNVYNTFASILCRNIRGDLIEQGKISSISDKVPHELLSNIKELNLSGELINDPEASLGIKYFENLETLDLSDNDLDNLDFVSSLRNLKNVDLSNNKISSVDSIISNEGLLVLDLSNNRISDISKLQYLHKIEKLDLSNNKIESINPLNSSYSLKSLFVNNNALTNYKECLSNLEYLEELGVGFCNIPFTEIKSLSGKYLGNLKTLDISGTIPNLNLISGLSKLTSLSLQDCKLNEIDLSPLNKLTNLEMLNISDNNIDPISYNNVFSETPLDKLTHLYFGGNAFTSIPDLSQFDALEVLDLTNSYNLTNIDSLRELKVKELILDKCNSIIINDDGASYISTLESLPDLEKLSIQDGFNYITEGLYKSLIKKVDDAELSLRFLDNTYVDYSGIYNYSRAVFFSFADFINACVKESDGSYTVSSIGQSQQIIVSIINDGSVTGAYRFNIDKSLFQLDIYANKNKTYNFAFKIKDRKQSSFDLSLADFTNDPIDGASITAESDCKLDINVVNGTNRLSGAQGYNAINAYDVTIYCKSSAQLLIYGGNGANGANGVNNGSDSSSNSAKRGQDGTAGAAGIRCNSLYIVDKGVTVTGGRGGNGGNGGDGQRHDMWDGGSPGGNGGNGGRGGNAVEYKEYFHNPNNCSLVAGNGGNGGSGGDRWGIADDGSNGSNGGSGSASVKI